MKDILYIGALAVSLMVVAPFLIKTIAKHDQQVMQASKAYEQCIKKQYGVTPSMYYQALGEYPVCE